MTQRGGVAGEEALVKSFYGTQRIWIFTQRNRREALEDFKLERGIIRFYILKVLSMKIELEGS